MTAPDVVCRSLSIPSGLPFSLPGSTKLGVDVLPGLKAEDSSAMTALRFLLRRQCPEGFSLVIALCPTRGLLR